MKTLNEEMKREKEDTEKERYSEQAEEGFSKESKERAL